MVFRYGFGLIVAGEAAFFLYPTGSHKKRCFKYAVFKIRFVLAAARDLYQVDVATGTRNLGGLEYLMGDRLLARGLDRFLRECVAELASASALVKLDVREMALKTGGLGYLKFLLVRLVLVA